jgi:hypothetical protein
MSLVKHGRLKYHFFFNDVLAPTHCQIYPRLFGLYVGSCLSWIVDFEMEYVQGGIDGFGDSHVWRRKSKVMGQATADSDYYAVQVMDGNGEKIEPAWSKWLEYNASIGNDTISYWTGS